MRNTSPYTYYSPRNNTNPVQNQSITKQQLIKPQLKQIPISHRYTIENTTKNLNQEKSIQTNKIDVQNRYKLGSAILNKEGKEKIIKGGNQKIKQQNNRQKNKLSTNFLNYTPYSQKFFDNHQVKAKQQIQRLKNLQIDSNKIIQKSNQYIPHYELYQSYQSSNKSNEKVELYTLKDNYWKQRNQYGFEFQLKQKQKKLKELQEKVILLDDYKRNNQQLINYYKQLSLIFQSKSEYISRQDLKNNILANMRELDNYRKQYTLVQTIKNTEKQLQNESNKTKPEPQKQILEKILENDYELTDSAGSNKIIHKTNSNEIDGKQMKIKLITSMEEVVKQNNSTYNKTYKLIEEENLNLKNIIAQQKEIIQELQKKLEQNKKYLENKEKQCEIMKSVNSQLTEIMDKKSNQIQGLKNLMKQSSIQVDKHKEEIQIQRNDIKNLKIEISNLKMNIHNLKTQIESLSSKKLQLQYQIHQITQNKLKIQQTLTTQINQLKQSLSKIKENNEESKKIKELVNQLHESNQKNKFLEYTLKNIEINKFYKDEEQKILIKKINHQQQLLKQSQQKYTQRIHQLQIINAKLNSQLSKLQQNIFIIQQQTSRQILERQNKLLILNKQFQAVKQKHQQYNRQNQENLRKLAILEVNRNSLEIQLNQSYQELEHYKCQYRNLQNKILEYQERLQQKNKEIKPTESTQFTFKIQQYQQIDYLTTTLKKYEAQLEQSSILKVMLEKQIQELKKLNLRYQEDLQVKNKEIQNLYEQNQNKLDIDFITRKKNLYSEQQILKNTPQQLTPIKQAKSESASNTSMNINAANQIISQTKSLPKQEQIIKKKESNIKAEQIIENKTQKYENLPQKPSILEKKKQNQKKKQIFQNPFEQKNFNKINAINQSNIINQSKYGISTNNIPQVNIQKIVFNYKKQAVKLDPVYTSRITHINNQILSPNTHQNNFINQNKIISSQQISDLRISPQTRQNQKSLQKNQKNSKLIMKQSLINSGNYKINVISPQSIKQNKSPNQMNQYFRGNNPSSQMKNLNLQNKMIANSNNKIQINSTRQIKLQQSSLLLNEPTTSRGLVQRTKLINQEKGINVLQLQNAKKQPDWC